MATISTYSNLTDAVLALQNIFEKLFRIETAVVLLQAIEKGEIKGVENYGVDFTSLATESLTNAMSGIFEDCEEIRGYLESVGGDRFINLVDGAKLVKQAINAQDTPEGRAQS